MKKIDEKLQFVNNIASMVVSFFNLNHDVAFFIGCQFALESNFGTSNLATELKNYCGMKRPFVRITTSKNHGNLKYLQFAGYDSLEFCVLDFILCLQYRRPMSTNLDTIEHYCSFITPWYCPEKSYIDNIKSIYSQLKSYKNGN